MLTADGLDSAFLGIARRHGQPDLAVYSIQKAEQEILSQGATCGVLTIEEAREHLDYNLLGGWVGETTPIWLDEMSLEMAEMEKETERRTDEGGD